MGLIAIVAVAIFVAIWLDSSDSNEVATIDPDTSAAPADASTVDPAADPATADPATADPQTVQEIPTAPAVQAVDAMPTSVFVPAGGAAPATDATADTTSDTATDTAPDADAATAGQGGAVGAAGLPDINDDADDGEVVIQVTPTPDGPAPDATPRPADPFAFAGPAGWWTQDFDAEGATINTNELDFVINRDGTGSFRGNLDVSWPDGRSITVMVDEDYLWDNERVNPRATLRGEATIDGESVTTGTMAIREASDGFGSLCFDVQCVSFQFDPPFWSLGPG